MTGSRAVLALGWLVLLGVPAAAQTPRPAPDRPLRHGYLGATRCVDGVPTTFIDPHLDPRERAEIEAHEAVHRRQLAGDCDARLRAVEQDDGLRLDREAEAYCGGLAALELDSLRYGVAVERLRLALYDVFERRAHDEVDQRLGRYCRTGSPVSSPARPR